MTIFDGVRELLAEHAPDAVALEGRHEAPCSSQPPPQESSALSTPLPVSSRRSVGTGGRTRVRSSGW